MNVKVGSLFAGVGGFDVAFERAGFDVAWQVEKDAKCVKVLEERFPNVQRFSDVEKVTGDDLRKVTVLVGGFPCQDISVAGRRAGLDGTRSGLWWEYHRLIGELVPEWVVIENVAGLLSSGKPKGSDMGAILGALGELGYGFAYRVLDAQGFGVPQRRRRVFIVGCLGDGRRAAEVLLEPESGGGDLAKGREKEKGVAALTSTGVGTSRNERLNGEMDNFIPYSIGKGSDVLYAKDLAQPVTNRNGDPGHVAFAENQRGDVWEMDVFNSLSTLGGKPGSGYPAFRSHMTVRRLTPLECTRLQGFPHDWLVNDADADEAHARQVLRGMWKTIEAGAREGRRFTIVVALLTPEVLLAGLHVGRISWPMVARCLAVRRTLPSTVAWSPDCLRTMWEWAECGSSPHRPRSIEQLADQLGRPLPPMSHFGASAIASLRSAGVWEEAQRQWPVLHAQSTNEDGKETCGCGLNLSDSTRYKQMGNAVAVPVVEWIARRIMAVCSR